MTDRPRRELMNNAGWILTGVLLTFGIGWFALVLAPSWQMSRLQAQVDAVMGEEHPPPYSGAALRGRAVYIREGCTYCHSQQVRGGDWNADMNRGWGTRRSHPRDYIRDYPQLLGTMRTGPDLASIGLRQPSEAWHLKHLYEPQSTSPGSNMAPYRFLFEKRAIVGEPSPDALQLEGEFAPEPGMEVVPTQDAKDLVAYLKHLDQSYEIVEGEASK